jgi:ribosomal-protein-serine acetyltransferase
VLRELFLPEALIICRTGELRSFNLEQFIAPRVRLLADGTLTDFAEWELSERTEIFDGIALRSSRYRKSGVLNGARFESQGVKLMQLVRTTAGWRLSSLSWEDE